MTADCRLKWRVPAIGVAAVLVLVALVAGCAPEKSASAPLSIEATPTKEKEAAKGTPPSKYQPATREEPKLPEPDEEKVEFVEFGRLPFDFDDVAAVSPIGGFGGTHTRDNPSLGRPYGTERHFIWHKTPGIPYNVYAPTTAYIISVRKSQDIGDYGLDFRLYGDSHFRLDHINVLEAELESRITSLLGGEWKETSPFILLSTPILVHEGDVLGQTGVHANSVNWDWFVMDRTWQEGVVAPDHYWSPIFAYSRSVYDLSSEAVKQQLASLAGSPGRPQTSLPMLGQFGSDVPGTLSGTWFLDYENDPRWGPKLAIFRPHFLDAGKLEIKLAIPELDLYGVWVIPMSDIGNTNLDPKAVTAESGIVYYVLEDTNSGRPGSEFGLLLVQVNRDGTITLETRRDAFDPEGFPEFTGTELTLRR